MSSSRVSGLRANKTAVLPMPCFALWLVAVNALPFQAVLTGTVAQMPLASQLWDWAPAAASGCNHRASRRTHGMGPANKSYTTCDVINKNKTHLAANVDHADADHACQQQAL